MQLHAVAVISLESLKVLATIGQEESKNVHCWSMRVLAVDPGSVKCGLALVEAFFYPDEGSGSIPASVSFPLTAFNITDSEGSQKKEIFPVRVVFKEIIPVDRLLMRVREILLEMEVNEIVCGNSTCSENILKILENAIEQTRGQGMTSCSGEKLRVELVDEENSTLEARAAYFKENPPRGIWRFIPLSLQSPPGPIDDFVAVEIARRYISRKVSENSR